MYKEAGVTLLVLVTLLNFYLHINRTQRIPHDEDIGIDRVRYSVEDLAKSISKLNVKHSRLQTEIGRLAKRLSVLNSLANANVDSSRSPQRSHYDYDKQARDFALESAGARILDTGSTRDHFYYDSFVTQMLYSMTSVLCPGCDGARTMLQPGSMPGECWAFKGSRGEAVIRLVGKVKVTGIAIEHISTQIAPTGDISSAPRRVQMEGLGDPGSSVHDFGEFEYNREGSPIQYFEVKRPAARFFSMVRVRYLSNWGHPVYTCVYRFRVHGELAPGEGYPLEKVDDAGDHGGGKNGDHTH